jgi:hypothetical protein
MKTEADAIRQKLALAVGENAYGKSNVAKVSYLTQERQAVDYRALSSKFPQAYRECVNHNQSRVLRVTALKGE